MEAAMSARIVRLVSTLLTAALLIGAAPADAAKTYRAEQFTVRIDVQPDGSVRVTETIRFAFGPDSFTYVYREVPERRTDGVTYLGASMDGVPMDRGAGAGQFEVRKRDNGRRRVVFHFAPLTASAHTFTLTYQAAGVVRQDADADVLAWNLLPVDHEYVIDRATAEIVYPPTTRLLDAEGANEKDRNGAAEPGTVRATRSGVGPDEAWAVTLRFAPRTLAATAPRWQQRQARTREYMPLFLGLAGLILLTGGGGFLLFRLNHRPESPDDPQSRTPTPPDRLPVGLAGAVTGPGGSATWPHALGALLDLVRRGAVRIEANPDPGLFKTKPFLLRRTGTRPLLASHEQALLDILFTTKRGPRETITFSEVSRAVASTGNWKRFRKAVTADLRSAGLLDPEAERLRARVMTIGVGFVVAFIPALAACVPLLDRVGDAVLAIPMSLVAVGAVGLGAGASLNVLSAEGHRRARAVKAYRRYLVDLTKQPSPSGAEATAFEQALPYAAAFGVAVSWARHLQKQGVTNGPAWLGSLTQDATRGGSHMAATIAVLSAGSSAGGHAGGSAAGGAGAAGGGASGAG
jgi:hypothetical protein